MAQTCTSDAACARLTDATYTCYVGGGGRRAGGGAGACRIECAGASDATSCPQGMVYLDTSGGNAFRYGFGTATTDGGAGGAGGATGTDASSAPDGG